MPVEFIYGCLCFLNELPWLDHKMRCQANKPSNGCLAIYSIQSTKYFTDEPNITLHTYCLCKPQKSSIYGICKHINGYLWLADFHKEWSIKHVDALVQDCSISIAITLEILQFCPKPSMYTSMKFIQWIHMCYSCQSVEDRIPIRFISIPQSKIVIYPRLWHWKWFILALSHQFMATFHLNELPRFWPKTRCQAINNSNDCLVICPIQLITYQPNRRMLIRCLCRPQSLVFTVSVNIWHSYLWPVDSPNKGQIKQVHLYAYLYQINPVVSLVVFLQFSWR